MKRKGHGISTLEKLKGRCRVDDITGCWEWAGATSVGRGKLQVPEGLFPGHNTHMSTQKAAWLLAGRSLTPGHMVYRAVCWNLKCCNPDHLKSGTSKQMGADATKTGHLQGCPIRAAINARASSKLMTPAEKVREVEILLRSHTHREAARIANVSADLIHKVAKGVHPHQRAAVCKHASVFAWGGA